MAATTSSPQTTFLIIAIVVLVVAAATIRIIGQRLRARLGDGARRGSRAFSLDDVANVPQALVKEALARGLVTPSQLANMSPAEREFVFASLRKTIEGESRR
jgi:hypothetical protein